MSSPSPSEGAMSEAPAYRFLFNGGSLIDFLRSANLSANTDSISTSKNDLGKLICPAKGGRVQIEGTGTLVSPTGIRSDDRSFVLGISILPKDEHNTRPVTIAKDSLWTQIATGFPQIADSHGVIVSKHSEQNRLLRLRAEEAQTNECPGVTISLGVIADTRIEDDGSQRAVNSPEAKPTGSFADNIRRGFANLDFVSWVKLKRVRPGQFSFIHDIIHQAIMSHFRRGQGRFSSTTTSEAYQRQLAAPVHKWKKAWVTPTGLAPESSYKICKWVRVDDANDEDEAGEEEGDGEEGDEGEGEAMEEDDVEAEAEAGVEGEDSPTKVAGTPLPQIDISATPLPPSSLPLPPKDDPIPSNAIEMVNAPPNHAEEGLGDLGKSGVEIHLPMEKSVESSAAGGKDEGLVMGEMDAPDGDMTVDGEKAAGPPEVEK